MRRSCSWPCRRPALHPHRSPHASRRIPSRLGARGPSRASAKSNAALARRKSDSVGGGPEGISGRRSSRQFERCFRSSPNTGIGLKLIVSGGKRGAAIWPKGRHGSPGGRHYSIRMDWEDARPQMAWQGTRRAGGFTVAARHRTQHSSRNSAESLRSRSRTAISTLSAPKISGITNPVEVLLGIGIVRIAARSST